jgi:hypothetical protein
VAQVAERLSSKHEVLNSIPSTAKKNSLLPINVWCYQYINTIKHNKNEAKLFHIMHEIINPEQLPRG